jgi:mRNA deadenylase 3'-5' endonuclease subunit Ccr4
MDLTVATYNILADAYVDPKFYPHTPASVLEPARRRLAVVDRVAELDADVIGLQEVERGARDAIDARLSGHASAYAMKGKRRPDGCMTIHRSHIAVAKEQALHYGDGSGHVALLVVFEIEGALVGVANTHFKWDPPDTERDRRHTLRQATELLATSRSLDPCPWIVLGDLNVEPDSAAIQVFRDAGFADAHEANVMTANSNGRAKKIDFLLHDARLVAAPRTTATVEDDTPLPSDAQPSDHVPLVATFSLRSG